MHQKLSVGLTWDQIKVVTESRLKIYAISSGLRSLIRQTSMSVLQNNITVPHECVSEKRSDKLNVEMLSKSTEERWRLVMIYWRESIDPFN